LTCGSRAFPSRAAASSSAYVEGAAGPRGPKPAFALVSRRLRTLEGPRSFCGSESTARLRPAGELGRPRDTRGPRSSKWAVPRCFAGGTRARKNDSPKPDSAPTTDETSSPNADAAAEPGSRSFPGRPSAKNRLETLVSGLPRPDGPLPKKTPGHWPNSGFQAPGRFRAHARASVCPRSRASRDQ